MTIPMQRLTSLAPAVLAALSLAACEAEPAGERDGAPTVGAASESPIERTQERLASAGEKARRALTETGERLQPKIEAAGERLSEAAGRTAETVRDSVGAGDAQAEEGSKRETITTTVRTGPSTSVRGLPEGTRAAVNDAAITAAVKAGLLKDRQLSGLKIDVDTRGGVVVLNGVAESDAARERASRIAGDIKGVREVRNHLVIKQG